MSAPETLALYDRVSRSPELEQVIRDLSAAELRGLLRYVTAMQMETGVPGFVLGLLICEASERFMNTPPNHQGGAE